MSQSAPWMAPRDAADGEPGSPNGAVLGERLEGIRRTGWRETTRREPSCHQLLVEANEPTQNPRHWAHRGVSPLKTPSSAENHSEEVVDADSSRGEMRNHPVGMRPW